jgi:uncharacterized linocin/CFP29 family protein
MQDLASVDTGASLIRTTSGRWAAEQFLKAAKTGKMSSEILRTLDTLNRDEWIFFDNVVLEEALIVLRGVQDLIGAGLTRTLTNSLGKTLMSYERITDMGAASVSLDGQTQTENDRQELDLASLPIPITHKDWFIDLRTLVASRERGESIDTSNMRQAGRRVSEMAEQMLFQGGKTFGGFPIYGYTTHPNRLTGSFTNGNWANPAKTGADYLADILSMITKLQNNHFYGPYWLYVGRDADVPLDNDFKALGTLTIRQRLMAVEGLAKISVVDQLPAANLVMVAPTSDVVQWVQGEPLQNVQWDSLGGFRINFKTWQIGVPLIKATASGKTGVVHIA